MIAADQTKISMNEFLAMVYAPENTNRRLELINGEIAEKVTKKRHGRVSGKLIGALDRYFEANPIGYVENEVLYRDPQDPENAFKPDISVCGNDYSGGNDDEYAFPFPWIAVEIKSESNTYVELRNKAAYYLAHGVKLVWLLYPLKRLMEVYTPTSIEFLMENEMLTGGDVLPGFNVAVKMLFPVAQGIEDVPDDE